MRIVRQLGRFGLVGLATNGLLFFAYLLMTQLGLPPLLAMTLAFIAGVGLSWYLNAGITFQVRLTSASLKRMFATYFLAYLANLAGLWFAIHLLGMPHWLAQGLIIVMLAVALFFLQRSWVFADPH